MRKDVKFGLTIGAILVVTLVVYIIVLTRGNDKPQTSPEVKLVTPDNGSAPSPLTAPVPAQTPTPVLSHDTPPAHDPVATHVDPTATLPDVHVDAAPTPPLAPDPTTQPSVTSHATNWDVSIKTGIPTLSAPVEPEHTMTPPLPARPGIVSAEGHPVIDGSPVAGPVDAPGRSDAGSGPKAVADDPSPTTRPAVASGPRTHTVASHESLSAIAKAVYGNAKYWNKILAANPGINPHNLKIGTTLTIPDLSATSSSGTASDHGADVPTSAETTAGASTPIDPATSYKVVSGDSLEKIALKLYGKAEMKDDLYESNKALIGANPNNLKIGWVLKLPTAPTATASR